MAGIGKFKLADALRPPERGTGRGKGGKPARTHGVVAEQIREAQESKEARVGQVSNRDRMVDIGRGNQQSGRQGQ